MSLQDENKSIQRNKSIMGHVLKHLHLLEIITLRLFGEIPESKKLNGPEPKYPF